MDVLIRLCAAAALAGCWAPPTRDCSLRCSAVGACPSGYACLADDFCHATVEEALCGEDPMGGQDAGASDGVAAPPDAGPPPPDATPFLLDDPLRGSTLGHPVGGMITANGWEVTERTDRLWYEVPVLTSGAIEFTVANVTSGPGGNLPLEDHELFTMYEAGHGISEPIPYLSDYRNNNFKVMMRVSGRAAPSDVGRQQLRWKNCASGAPGYSGDGSCSCAAGFEGESLGGDGTWDGTAQRIRIAWTERGAILMRNGTLVAQLDWTGTTSFGPTVLHFALGSSRPDQIAQSGMPIGAVFSDVHVDGLIGTPLPECP